MEKRKLGRSGIEVSPMGLGCWAIGGNIFLQGMPLGWSTVDDNESVKALQRGIEMGINFIDTADMYGTGHSEKLVGEAIKGKRDKVVIATKFGMTFEPGSREILSMEGDASPEYIRKAVEDSLARLQTDYIDLYQLHIAEYQLDKAQLTRDALEDLVKAVKIRSYGDFDQNGDSLIELNELPKDMMIFTRPDITDIENTQWAIGSLFNGMDKDKNGFINNTEWTKAHEYSSGILLTSLKLFRLGHLK